MEFGGNTLSGSINENRDIILCGNIDEMKVDMVANRLLDLMEKDKEAEKNLSDYKKTLAGELKLRKNPINLYIQTSGGSLYDALFLYDLIMNSTTEVHTIVTGAAMSAGFILFLAGRKRFITHNATVMIHQPFIMDVGKFKDVQERGEEDKWLIKTIESIITSRTKISKKEVDDMIEYKRDIYFHSKEALEKRIATHLLSEKS